MPQNNSKQKNNSQLLAMRHSAQHVLTQAMVDLYGSDKVIMAMGPATDDGFYFDFDSPESFKVSNDDFPSIEAKMQKLIDADLPIIKEEWDKQKAKDHFQHNKYKMEWINEIEGDSVTIYRTGDNFVDLCAGPHLSSTGKIGSFKLLSIAGAYWRGSEKNKMLTRIYGTAFKTQKELDEYLTNLEEAKKRDHRKLGKELDLFIFSDLVGKGLPLLTSKGATIHRILERFIIDEEIKRGYEHVITPPLAKADLYRKSGHYPYYKDTMYPIMVVDDEELILRPMTCPHHFMLYNSKSRSYKNLPLRIAEIASQFRYEKSGELTGLMRVRTFCLADAHIIAKPESAEAEIEAVLDLIDFINKTLGMKKGIDYRYRLSLGNRKDSKKYYKDDKAWDHAENVLRKVLEKTNKDYYFEKEDEAAFYGPKIDIQIKNTLGKEETAFTVQYDFVMPKRFNMTYIDKQGQKKEPIVIHRSSLGAFERTMAFLIEHYAGAFPLWLAPIQLMLLTISEHEVKFASQVVQQLKDANIRVELDSSDKSLGKKVALAKKQKPPYIGIIGKKETKDKTITLKNRQDEQVTLNIKDTISKLQQEIQSQTYPQ